MNGRLLDKVSKILNGRKGAHSLDHFLRVYNIANYIGKHEVHNSRVLKAMCLLHDVVRYEDDLREKYNVDESVKLSKKILLSLNYRPFEIDLILSGIKSHSLHSPERREPETIEAKILFDADKLEGCGYIGVARWFMVFGSKSVDVLSAANLYLDTVHAEKLRIGKLYTATGNSLFKERISISTKFMHNLINELEYFGAGNFGK